MRNESVRRVAAGAWLVAALAGGTAAEAHDLACGQTVDGATLVVIDRYPVKIRIRFTVRNLHPSAPSTALTVDDPLLDPRGFRFTPAAPFTLPVGGEVDWAYDLLLSGPADCQQLGATNPIAAGTPIVLDSNFLVGWDLGHAQCSLRIVCMSPREPPPCGPVATAGCKPLGSTPPETAGWLMVHETALDRCIAQGPVELGALIVGDQQEAMGVLWGDPLRTGDGTPRGEVDKHRFALQRQLLATVCGTRLEGASSVDPLAIHGALTALAGGRCGEMDAAADWLDGLNRARAAPGDGAGPATPTHARSLAVDPTLATGQRCLP